MSAMDWFIAIAAPLGIVVTWVLAIAYLVDKRGPIAIFFAFLTVLIAVGGIYYFAF